MRNVITALVATGGLLGATASVWAAPPNPATATFTVSASVAKVCTVTANNLAFGTYIPNGGSLFGTSTVTVTCTNGTGYTVDLDKGTTTGGTVAQRLMLETGGTGTLQYNLCTTPVQANGTCATGNAWGDGTTLGTANQSGTGTGMSPANAKQFTVNGAVPDNATNQAALVNGATTTTAYSDSVTVLVAY
jgi:spore coat protein U-like protein